jgi:hypothetical protein
MAKLFIGCDYISFNYAKAKYQGVVSKIILSEKTIFRVDYTSLEDNHSGRFEISCIKDDRTDEISWIEHLSISPELTHILQGAIEKNARVMQLES